MKLKFKLGDIVWLLVLVAFFSIFIIPQAKEVYENFNMHHPYAAGFIKFMVLASMGELLAQRLATGKWKKTKGFFIKAAAWGVIGIMVTFMFKLYPYGIETMINKGLIPGADGFLGKLLFGFYTSIVVNLSFGPVFMSMHRISDTKIEAFADRKSLSFMGAIREIDWAEFMRFIVGKTIPYFWIPAHTITFLLPENYRILFAAMLSVALGVILTLAKNRKKAD